MKRIILVAFAFLWTASAQAFLTIENEHCFVKTTTPLNELASPDKSILYTKAIDLIGKKLSQLEAESGGFSFFDGASAGEKIKNANKALDTFVKDIAEKFKDVDLSARGNRVYSQNYLRGLINGLKNDVYNMGDELTPAGFVVFGGFMAQVPLPWLSRLSGSFASGWAFVPQWVTVHPKKEVHGFCKKVFDRLGETSFSYLDVDVAGVFVPVGDINLQNDGKVGLRGGVGVFYGHVEKASDFQGYTFALSVNKDLLARSSLGRFLTRLKAHKLNLKIGTVSKSLSHNPLYFGLIGGDHIMSLRGMVKGPDKKFTPRGNFGYIFSRQQVRDSIKFPSLSEMCEQGLLPFNEIDNQKEYYDLKKLCDDTAANAK